MQAIRAVLTCYKDTHANEQPRIITTGHSLGGALAIVAAVCIAHCIPGYCQDSPDYTSRNLQTYTFAAPRIGDRTLAGYLSSTLQFTAVQVKNKPDVVPYTPPAGDHMSSLTSSPVAAVWVALPMQPANMLS
jgi:predicted lipase